MVTYSKSMKTKLFVLFFLILLQFGFSQNEKLIEGIVLCDNLPLQGIEIVNIVSEKTAITDIDGKFSILVKVEDMLVFVSKKYFGIENGYHDNYPKEAKEFYRSLYSIIDERLIRKGIVPDNSQKGIKFNEFMNFISAKAKNGWKTRSY